ncbi:MAG: glycosyltransferase family 4 protein [Omnitrophica WOR_2 bacterium]
MELVTRPKTKILFLAASDDLYGSDVVLLDLLNRLDLSNFEPVVVVPSDVKLPGRFSRKLSQAGIRYYHYPLAIIRRKYLNPSGLVQYLFLLIKSCFWLSRLSQKEKVNLIHTNSLMIIPGAVIAAIKGIPHVWHIHEAPGGPALLQKIQAMMLQHIGIHIIAVSDFVKKQWTAINPALQSKMVMIHNGVDLSQFYPGVDVSNLRKELGCKGTHSLIGVVGRISYRKGQHVFIKAIPPLIQKFPQARFIIVGDVFPDHELEYDSLIKMVSDYGLKDYVIISPYKENIAQVIAAIDILVLPSIMTEAFPTILLEAMASAKPVIATACGGAEEIVTNQEDGMIIPMNDPDSLSKAISFLLQNPDFAKNIGKAGRGKMEQEMTIQNFTQRLIDLYQSIVQ